MFFSMSVEALNLMRSRKKPFAGITYAEAAIGGFRRFVAPHFTFSYQIKTYLQSPGPVVC